ncbi:MAG: spore coat associated protein CotJA [Lachnospiraceae bacterium]
MSDCNQMNNTSCGCGSNGNGMRGVNAGRMTNNMGCGCGMDDNRRAGVMHHHTDCDCNAAMPCGAHNSFGRTAGRTDRGNMASNQNREAAPFARNREQRTFSAPCREHAHTHRHCCHLACPNTDDQASFSCYSVAMGYVPWQMFRNVFEPEKGFSRGTIFQDLDLPFLGNRGCI